MKKLTFTKTPQNVLIVIVLVVISAFGGYSFYSYSQKPTVKAHADTYTLEKVGELDTLSIKYDKTLEQDEPGKFLGLKVGTEKSLYIFHFKAQIYYNLDDAISRYNKDQKTLTVTMPTAKIKLLLKDNKYTGDFDYYKLKNNAFVKDSNDKGLKVQQEAIKDVKADILKMKDIVPSAQKSATTTITQMFANDPIKVIVNFK